MKALEHCGRDTFVGKTKEVLKAQKNKENITKIQNKDYFI